jgi:nicotinate dehydrogenase subunit B
VTVPAEPFQLVVNGVTHELAPGPDRSLLFALREELGSTGAKPGCGEGECGACTVLLDGQPVQACQTRLSQVAGRAVTTVEGLAHGGRLHPAQRAFLEVGALQCGYCTAGMLMSTVALLEREPDPDEATIRSAMAGNICRCGTYPRILRAVRRAAELAAAPPGNGGEAGQDTAAVPSSDVAATDPGAGYPAGPTRPGRPWDLSSPEQRDWFDVLPDGLVVTLERDRTPEPGRWTTSPGAWLHIGSDGTVTSFTGKVDVGQDNRTALSLLVAEELRVPLASVRLVMGDTDVCPYDAGTFGSRSMPDAGERLRQVAAAARESLLGLAAGRWGMATTDLVAADGAIRTAEAGPSTAGGSTRRSEATTPTAADSLSLAYADLVRGLRRVDVANAATAPTPGPLSRTVARPSARLSAAEIVTGAKRYPSDMSLPGMRYGRVLRPPAVGATLRSLDTSKAAALPGITLVEEGPFVGVVARDPFSAGRAIGAIEADWEPAPTLSEDGLEAYLRAHPAEEEGWEGAFHREIGDPDGALASAPIRLSATYTSPYIAHVPLETHVALATWEGDRLTVWCGTQQPFGVRAEVAEALGVPEVDVRVIVPDTGGGFGGKHGGEVAAAAARLSRAADGPVKVRWGREEEFVGGYLRPAAVIDIRSGARRDGTIAAWEMRDTNAGMFGLVGPYEIPDQRLDHQPADSPLPQGSYRALAATVNHFARESHMDELAHATGVDPLELRLAHLRDDRLAAVFRAAAERIGWPAGSSQPGRGVGIAGGVEKGARIATCVDVRVGTDRRLEILRIVSAVECGAIVDPGGLVNQVEGATVMGLGGALFEAIHFESGRITNGSMAAYRVPRITDVPPIEVVLLDRPDLPSAGAGETPIVAVAPALANAIFAATGVRLRSLPLAPDGVVP